MSAKDSKPALTLPQLFRWVLHYAARRRGPLAAVLGSMLLKVGLDVLKPWPMIFLVDHVLKTKAMPPWLTSLVNELPGPHTPGSLIAWSVLATVLVFLLSWAVGLASAYASISLGQRMVYDVAADLFANLQRLSLRFHASKSVGDNIRRVTADSASVSTILKDALLPVFSAIISLGTMFGIMWRIDSSLTLLALAVVPYMMLILQLYARPMLERSYQQQEIEGRIYDVTEQTFSAMPVIQAFGREDFNDERFRLANRDALAATVSLTKFQMQFKILIGLATAAGTAAILWFGTQHFMETKISLGDIVLFLSYLGSLYGPLES